MSDDDIRDGQDVRQHDGRTPDGATVEHGGGADTRAVEGRTDDGLIGTTIDGKYVVEALIGAGGMGRVYRGRNTRTDSPVAIKTLLPDLLVDDTLTKRFEVEAKAASNLRHPNTIRIFDFGHEGEVLFMVMELLSGQSLDALLAEHAPLPPVRVLHIVREVCKSLDEAHKSGLIHRDIKPDNIFLNRVGESEDQIKVLDFGVAKLKNKQQGQATLTQAGMIFGTPRYMSPEQARAFELDGRSDIYALGVIMFEALTGSPPFVGDDPVSVLIKHVNEPIPSFLDTNPSVPEMPEIEALVRRCMAKEPDQRFDDVRNLMNAIDGVAALYGVAAPSGHTGSVPTASPSSTAAFPNSGPNTPQQLKSEGFETLGVSTGQYESGPQVAAAATPPPNRDGYTIGASRTDVPTRDHGMTSGSPIARVAMILGAIVVLAGGALLVLIGGGGDDPAPPPDDEPPGPSAPANGLPIAPVVSVAGFEVRDAVAGATRAAAARVVPMELRVEPEDAGAVATIDGVEGDPIPLPHTFVFTRDPASPPARVTFNVSAEGYRDATHEAQLAPTGDPIVVTLRRRSSGSSPDRNSGVWVPPPRERERGGDDGFDDPYRR